MAELIAESNLKVNNLSINKINEPKVLIAGCGTGQQSLYRSQFI